MEIVYRKTSDLIPYQNNPRNNDGAVDAVAASIREFGFKVPIIIDRDGVIVAGHTRLKAAEKLGLAEVPCIVADDLTEEQVRAFRLADNKTAELAEWDFEKLQEELGLVFNLDMKTLGFEIDVESPSPEPGDVVEVDVNEAPATRAKLGDLWRLGGHRLLCGDSTKKEDLDRLMNGELADFVFTDPPYGVSIGSKNKTINSIEPGRGGAHTG